MPNFFSNVGNANILGQMDQALRISNRWDEQALTKQKQELLGTQIQSEKLKFAEAKKLQERLDTPMLVSNVKNQYDAVAPGLGDHVVQKLSDSGLVRPIGGQPSTTLRDLSTFANMLKQDKALQSDMLGQLLNSQVTQASLLEKQIADLGAKGPGNEKSAAEIVGLQKKLAGILTSQGKTLKAMQALDASDPAYRQKLGVENAKREGELGIARKLNYEKTLGQEEAKRALGVNPVAVDQAGAIAEAQAKAKLPAQKKLETFKSDLAVKEALKKERQKRDLGLNPDQKEQRVKGYLALRAAVMKQGADLSGLSPDMQGLANAMGMGAHLSTNDRNSMLGLIDSRLKALGIDPNQGTPPTADGGDFQSALDKYRANKKK